MYSPAMLKAFQSCPQKYWFKYKENIVLPQKASIFEKGKKVHALAHYYLKGDDISKLEQALSQEERNIWEILKNNEYFNKSYINSEYNLSCKIGDFWIGGRLDAIVKDEKNYYILDYKTGSIPKNPEFDFQTMVYLLCLYCKFNELNISFVYIDLKNNQNHVIEFTSQNAEKYKEIIIKTCKDMENIQFQEEIEHSEICEYCEYKKICF